jgi:hypothetical protein
VPWSDRPVAGAVAGAGVAGRPEGADAAGAADVAGAVAGAGAADGADVAGGGAVAGRGAVSVAGVGVPCRRCSVRLR